MTTTLRLVAGATALIASTVSGWAQSGALQDLANAAAGKGPVLWYESSPPEQIAAVIADFNKAYPKIQVQYVRNTGGNTLAARIIQETQAGGRTASLVTGGASHIEAINDRGLLLKRDWSALGLDKALTPAPHAVATTSSIYVALWNKTKVKDEEAPKTWEDFLDAKWANRIGSWIRAAGFAMLAKEKGEAAMRTYTERYAAQKPLLYQSTFPLAQQVAAGEVDVAIGIYHSAQPAIAAGAPVGFRFLEPTPLNTIWSGVVEKGNNPEGAQVLLAWLVTPDGARSYETHTGRGHPLAKGTKAAELVGNHKLSEWPFAENDTYERLEVEFSKILASGGTAKK